MLFLMIFLRYGIVGRRWGWSKWTYCLLILVSTSLYIGVDFAEEIDAALLASIGGTMLLLIAACFLFRRDAVAWLAGHAWKIGRASGGERGCQYVWISVVAVS